MNIPYGSIDEPTSLLLTTTNVTDVLSMAAGDKESKSLHGIMIVNQDSSERKVTVWWTANATDYRLFESTVPANESVQVEFAVPLKLYAKGTARKIKAQAAAANVITVTLMTSVATQSQAVSAG